MKSVFFRCFYEASFFCRLQGVRVSQFDVCAQQDPCQNGGACINTDTGPVCECGSVDFEGQFCEKGTPVCIPSRPFHAPSAAGLAELIVVIR